MTDRFDHTSRESRERGSDSASIGCHCCGDPIDTDDWHPVATRRDEDGRIQIHDFCCEDCRSAWVRERDRNSDYTAD
ncbi:DUF7576 family protein [Halorussus marinus]|uniref:DUF7576 family protein n=1 Tax=Halorussus marinus TaxID=2505976 RepID=UPI00106EEF18|nr:hypothetical protein [Halorussus marinus]